jgi:hypothetical protein
MRFPSKATPVLSQYLGQASTGFPSIRSFLADVLCHNPGSKGTVRTHVWSASRRRRLLESVQLSIHVIVGHEGYQMTAYLTMPTRWIHWRAGVMESWWVQCEYISSCCSGVAPRESVWFSCAEFICEGHKPVARQDLGEMTEEGGVSHGET